MSDTRKSGHILSTLATVLLIAPALTRAETVVFDVEGEVLTCNPFACGAVGIAVGNPLSGFIEVDDTAAGPNSTFTEADVPFLELTIGDQTVNGSGPDLGIATLTTDAAGEIVSGTVVVQTEADTGLGIAVVDITVDAASETWEAETSFFGLGVIASGTLGFTRVMDFDGDGLPDAGDNCIEVANADQRDSNADGIGNLCDPDLNNDCSVNFLDLQIMKQVFFSNDADADFDGSGLVNFADLSVMKEFFFSEPGPSGVPNDCDLR